MRRRKTLFNAPADIEPQKTTIKVGKTPIEIALGIDEQGRTTARKLYIFLELAQSQYARWCRNSITENDFAEENVDYFPFNSNVENSSFGTDKRNSTSMSNLPDKSKVGRGNTQDYILTATFAKKLAMASNSAKGELAREYFIRVEELLKRAVTAGYPEYSGQPVIMQKVYLDEMELLTMELAQTRYNIGRNAVMKIGKECDGIVRYGRLVRFSRRKFDGYFESLAGDV